MISSLILQLQHRRWRLDEQLDLVSAPDSAFYNWVEGSLVQRVHFSVPSQECVAGVGMQLPLSVKHEIIIVQDKWLLIET